METRFDIRCPVKSEVSVPARGEEEDNIQTPNDDYMDIASKMIEDTPIRTGSLFTIPVNTKSSVKFYTNEPVIRAEIYAGETMIGNVSDTAELDFFGGQPFHGGLSQGWGDKKIVIESEKIPSLIMHEYGSMDWKDVGEDAYESLGRDGRIFVYLKTACGYKTRAFEA